ncbi:conserved protein of unknown function [Rhodovastum atsumiense]|uniref:Uncharacterized protein n=1 Tax=Rhodovastum atsumiense TaxID=504468 RepID=A0A5M6IW61_9PROT|nr:hypothetical protein [Rhodovastum atsumiense]KAA5612570.1 hypothetical protein F1189_08935 [Rhodovastum atsumiense]CAH2601343.1 conserved protein of unknown function [Rhodovastum atsumiense]
MNRAGGNAAPATHGGSITYTLTGNLTGTLQDHAGHTITFAHTPFRWDVVGDIRSGTSLLGLAPVPVFEVPARSDRIAIGHRDLSPTIPTVFAVATVPGAHPFGIAGFSERATNHGLAWRSPRLAGYDGVSAIPSLPVSFDNAASLPTNGGDLRITTASDLHFRAVTG